MGWFFNGSGKAAAKTVATTGSSSNKSNTTNNSTPQKRQQKQHSNKSQHQTAAKMAKTTQKATKAVQTIWKVKSGGVFFTQQQEQGGPNSGGGSTPRNIKGVAEGWGEEEERLPVESRLCSRLFLDTSKICNNWSLTFSEVSWGGKSIVELFLTFCKSHWGFTRQR